MNDHLGRLLASTRALLLDFDGPICNPFAGYPAPQIADDLRESIRPWVSIPIGDLKTDDPLEFLRTIFRSMPGLLRTVEARLDDAERTAVRTAQPTPYAHALIATAARSGVPVAIVSNNSGRAIYDYLDLHDLQSVVATIVGRFPSRPNLMKPNPDPVIEALTTLGVHPQEATLVGDSVTDIEAAQKAETRSIGYAKHPSRVKALTEAGADAVVESIGDLVTRWNGRR